MEDNIDILRTIGTGPKTIGEAIDNIIGDTPVSVQLNAALNQMARKDHVHEDYVPRVEFESLKRNVETLIALVGDISVSEQISNAIEALKIT